MKLPPKWAQRAFGLAALYLVCAIRLEGLALSTDHYRHIRIKMRQDLNHMIWRQGDTAQSLAIIGLGDMDEDGTAKPGLGRAVIMAHH